MKRLSFLMPVFLLLLVVVVSVSCGKRGSGGGGGGGGSTSSGAGEVASTTGGDVVNGNIEPSVAKKPLSEEPIIEEEMLKGVTRGGAIDCNGVIIEPGSLATVYPSNTFSKIEHIMFRNDSGKKVGILVMTTSVTVDAQQIIKHDSPAKFSLLPGGQRVVEVSFFIPAVGVTSTASSPAVVSLDLTCVNSDRLTVMKSLGLSAEW